MQLSQRSAIALASAFAVVTAATAVPALSSPSPTARTISTVSTHSAQNRQGTYTSKVFGTWRHGTVRGSFIPVRSFVRNHQTWVQGDLTAKIRRSDGTLVGKTTRHDVTLPVKARGAHTTRSMQQPQQQETCPILHLVLGPLDLNLLGLHVHLNRVVLDITAQSGPGNLLGNLLCAVAHLLDNTSPTLTNILQLSSLLNRVISILT